MAGSRSDTAGVMVSVKDEDLCRLGEICDALRSIGMEVEQVMEQIGAITGTVEADKFSALRHVRGVSFVESVREVHLPPPDSELQ